MLRNRLFLLSFVALSGCAAISAQKTADEAAPKTQSAASQQPVASATVKAEQKAAPIQAAEKPSTVAAAAETTPAQAIQIQDPIVATAIAPATPPALKQAESNQQQRDLWQRIRSGYGMGEQESRLVGHYEKWYAQRPDYMARMTERGQRYLYFIVEEVEKRGMPMEIALLPMIESAFNPGAYSTARASGIWQFIPSTGKNFGMQQNWWYDGRRDVVSATKGALDYLGKLHDQFGAWDLALAAYNCGENCIMRAQARNKKRHLPTNYASLTLPKETRSYVPKLMAVKNIVSDPKSFGLTLTHIPNEPYFAEVNTSRHIDVELAAEMAGITMEEFRALNPAHNRPVILKKDNEIMLLPVSSVATFNANLEQANQPLVSWQACTTKKGQSLDTLASLYGITPEKLKTVNGIHRSVKVTNGQTLLVPLNGEPPESEFTAFNTNLPPTDNSLLNAIRHTVRRGDTLSGIAHRYHVNLSSLKSWNRGVKILRVGQHIMVAQPGRSQPAAKPVQTAKRATALRNLKRAAVSSKKTGTAKKIATVRRKAAKPAKM